MDNKTPSIKSYLHMSKYKKKNLFFLFLAQQWGTSMVYLLQVYAFLSDFLCTHLLRCCFFFSNGGFEGVKESIS